MTKKLGKAVASSQFIGHLHRIIGQVVRSNQALGMTMRLQLRDHVWNRAALEGGGPAPLEGDIALAALLHFHGAAMNGGLEHAIFFLTAAELSSAIRGFRFFGLDHAAALPERARVASEAQLESLQTLYGQVIPSDSTLVSTFHKKFASSPSVFASITP